MEELLKIVLIVGCAVLSLAMLVGAVWVRGWSKGQFEPKLPDAIVAALPIVIVLIATGVINFGITKEGGVTLQVNTGKVILDASQTEIKQQVTELPLTRVDVSEKGGLGDLSRVRAAHNAGLSFSLAQRGYIGAAIQEYLDALVKDPAFQYVIIANSDKSVFGLFDGRKLNEFLKAGGSTYFNAFANALDNGDTGKLATSYSGFIPGSWAIRRNTPKDEALQSMDKYDVDWLPVVDENRSFVGIVDRTRLIASLILDVTKQLRQAQAKPST